MGGGIPVLACTATANDRVVADVAEQLGAVGNIIRGPLTREGLSLHVVDMPSAARRLGWLSTVLPTLEGTGIVYCLTVRDAERVAEWLRLHGHDVLAYTGGTEDGARLDAEERLQHNQVKALVATSALGMGYDKPDLAFVIHFQSPGSPVAYYQQVGRAGRQLKSSVGVLLKGVEDLDIQDWFIRTAFPDERDVDAVLDVFSSAAGPISISRVLEQLNMKRGDVDLVLKQLTVEGVLRRLPGSAYERTLKPWVYPTQKVLDVTADRRMEQEQMRVYGQNIDCRMSFLTQLLDDPDPEPCGVCDLCAGSRYDIELDDALVAEAEQFLRRGYVEIEPRKLRNGHKLLEDLRIESGRALSVWNDQGWGRFVAAGKEAGRFDDRLVDAAVRMVKDWAPKPPPEWVSYVPSLRHPELVPDLAARIAEKLRLRVVPIVVKVRDTPPQKRQQNSPHQEANVRGAFDLTGTPPAAPLLLVDDMVDSRWTLVEIGALLRERGSGAVHPLALASLIGRDS
jgi:ATP-dependent DNA helicase RecQ